MRLFAFYNVDLDAAQAIFAAYDKTIRVVGISPILDGMSTSNYTVSTDRRKYLLKIYAHPRSTVEPGMYAHLSGLVDTPKLLYYSDGGEVCPNAHAILEFIEGETLAAFIRRRKHFPEEIAQAAGRMLAGIHARTYSAGGLLDTSLRVISPLPGTRERLLTLAGGKAGKHLAPRARDKLLALCAGNERLFERLDAKSVLCHGDYGFGNILVSGDRVCFIDFEYAASGSMYRDIGKFFRMKDDDLQVHIGGRIYRAFAEGYGALPEDWQQIARIADIPTLLALIDRDDAPREWVTDIEWDILRAIGG